MGKQAAKLVEQLEPGAREDQTESDAFNTEKAESADTVTISRTDLAELTDGLRAMRAELNELKAAKAKAPAPAPAAVAAVEKQVRNSTPNPNFKGMTEVVSIRNFTLRTTKGHAIEFQARVPQYIPNVILPEAMERGCAPTDEADMVAFDDRRKARVEFQGDLRRSVLALFIMDIVDSNNSRDFDAAGIPKYQLVREQVGFDVTPKETTDIFREIESMQKVGETPDMHKHAHTVKRIIEASDKRELLTLVPETIIKLEDAEGMQTRDLRKAMLASFSGISTE